MWKTTFEVVNKHVARCGGVWGQGFEKKEPKPEIICNHQESLIKMKTDTEPIISVS